MPASEKQITPEQIKLVQESFAKIATIVDQAGIMFYNRLFELAPQLKTMFPAEMTEQRRKLVATLALAVNGLADLQSVLPAAAALAKRHIAYGVKPEHYPIVGSALLWTLEKGLGDAWTAETAEAWAAAYAALSALMIEEAYGRPKNAERA